jgi:transposase
VNETEKVEMQRKLRRSELIAFFEKQESCTVVMEACGAPHHWARMFAGLGHTVKSIAPETVKPFVKKGKKNDATDAAAICEAASRPDVKIVPTKNVEQQGILALHAAQSLLVKQQTMLANAMRGLATEFGVTIPKSIRKLDELMTLVDADESISKQAKQAITGLHDHGKGLSEGIETFECEIVAHARHDETARRLATIPGIGPITASLIVATVVDISLFKTARQFSAWLGLVPRQNSTGRKTRLGRITKTGNRGDTEVAGAGSHVDGPPRRRLEQRGRRLAPQHSGAPSHPAGDGGAGEQDGAHGLGVDDVQGGLPSEWWCRSSGASRRMTTSGRMAGDGRKLA